MWQQLFQDYILDRGFDYYSRKLVEVLYNSDDFIEATVNGSEEYQVHIDKEDGKIVDMSCTCPYAEGGYNCKHMAAVLFRAEDKAENGADRTLNEVTVRNTKSAEFKMIPKVESSVIQLVEGADEALVRSFLIGVLENDDKLQNRFKSIICSEISPEDMKRYKNQVDEIFRKYSGRHGFIDYYNASSFISELEEFLYNDIQGMLDNKKYEEAFELTNYIFIETGNQDMDDSDGDTGMLANKCLEIWQEILEHCNIKLKRKMFQWYTKHLNGSVIDYMEEYIEQILFEDFLEEEYLVEKLKFTEKKKCEYETENDSWVRGYHSGGWAIRHVSIMQDMKMTWDSIDKYCKCNWELSAIRKFYVEECIKRGEHGVAINVLEEGKNIDKDLRGLVSDYSLQLKTLYQKTGNQKAYEEELWSLMLNYKAGDVDIYKEIRSLYTAKEWETKREIVFDKLPQYSHVDVLYKEEKLYDRLLDVVMNSYGLYKLTEHEKCLKPLYPEELLSKYEIEVKNMASHTSDRKRYREIVGILRRMRKYPEGKERVQNITTEWRFSYRNRPAMMDELKKL